MYLEFIIHLEMLSAISNIDLALIRRGHVPLAFDWTQGNVILAHDVPDATAQQERRAGRVEASVEVDGAHALRLPLKQRAVVRVEQHGKEVCEHVFESACVYFVLLYAALYGTGAHANPRYALDVGGRLERR